MKVVSENSDRDVARHRLENEIAAAIRDLTANLIRITRGAGKAYEVGPQASRLVTAYVDYQEEIGHWPSPHLLSTALTFDSFDAYREYPIDDRMVEYERERIIKGALQITASRLLDQQLQVRAGEDELLSGVNGFEEARDRRRKKALGEIRGLPAKNRKSRRRKAEDIQF